MPKDKKKDGRKKDEMPRKKDKKLKRTTEASGSTEERTEAKPLVEIVQASQDSSAQQQSTTKNDFSAWYLRKVTMELQEDLDKVRSASDFNESSLPILIDALKQGEALFSPEERARIMGAERTSNEQ